MIKEYEFYKKNIEEVFEYTLTKLEYLTIINYISEHDVIINSIDNYLNINCINVAYCFCCYDCEMCEHCLGCIKCLNCKKCKNNYNCINCQKCYSTSRFSSITVKACYESQKWTFTNCNNCVKSVDCYNCNNCNECNLCCKCDNCINCDKCIRCSECFISHNCIDCSKLVSCDYGIKLNNCYASAYNANSSYLINGNPKISEIKPIVKKIIKNYINLRVECFVDNDLNVFRK